MSALDKLIEAVEAGGDWIGVEAGLALQPQQYADALRAYGQGGQKPSLDAALALHEALLPGHWLGGLRGNCGPKGENFVANVNTIKGVDCHYWDGIGATPARAWLLAILRAYRGMQQ